MPNTAYEYFAFISYCSKDGAAARRLQSLLERYRLPGSLRREDPSLPKQISPVFLDKSDLVPQGKLLQSLRDHLDASRSLIVLCSPDSARSPWVDQEVSYFIESGRTDRILPVILDGDPHAADPARECFPPSLAALGQEDEPTAIRLSDYGERGTLLRIAAALLDLKLDKVLERDAAYRRKKRVLFAAAAAAVLCAAFAVLWYLTPHSSYYRDYVLQWELPVGLGKVGASERSSLEYTYRITRQKGKTVSLERVNSAGELCDPSFAFTRDEAPRVTYSYVNGKTLSSAEYSDLTGQPLYQKKYSADLQAVDFTRSGADSYAFTLQSSQLVSQAFTPEGGSAPEGRSDIIRYLQTYDEKGFLLTRLFKRDNRGNGGTPARDSTGVWGLRFTRNAEGRILLEEYLDRNGSPMTAANGVAALRSEYDDSGSLLQITALSLDGKPVNGPDGYSSRSWSYDAQGCLAELVYKNADGEPIPAKAVHAAFLRFVFDSRGFLTEIRSYDSSGGPCTGYQGAFRCVLECDEHGNITAQSYFDADDAPAPCSDGFASETNVWGENHQLLECRYFDMEGEPVPCLTLGCYGNRFTYEEGKLVRIDDLDPEGLPMLTAQGYASVCYAYDAEGLNSSILYLDETGAPVRCSSGFAEIRNEYLDGTLIRWSDYDENGDPCLNSEGVSSCRYEYENGLQVLQSYFGIRGEPVANSSGCSVIRSEYDENGLLLRREFLDEDGRRVLLMDSISAIGWEYDETGRPVLESYFDTEDRPKAQEAISGGVAVRMEYDEQGNLAAQSYLFEGQAPSGVSVREEYAYDLHGNNTLDRCLDRDGKETLGARGFSRLEMDYDAADRLIEMRVFTPDSALPQYIQTITNDLFGHPVHVESIVRAGSATVRMEFRYEYDEFGNETGAWSRMEGQEDWEPLER